MKKLKIIAVVIGLLLTACEKDNYKPNQKGLRDKLIMNQSK